MFLIVAVVKASTIVGVVNVSVCVPVDLPEADEGVALVRMVPFLVTAT